MSSPEACRIDEQIVELSFGRCDSISVPLTRLQRHSEVLARIVESKKTARQPLRVQYPWVSDGMALALTNAFQLSFSDFNKLSYREKEAIRDELQEQLADALDTADVGSGIPGDDGEDDG